MGISKARRILAHRTAIKNTNKIVNTIRTIPKAIYLLDKVIRTLYNTVHYIIPWVIIILILNYQTPNKYMHVNFIHMNL